MLFISVKIKNIADLPTNPGCYLYKDKNNKVIYIGKAKNIKKRVNSYFHKKDLDIKTAKLVSNIVEVDFIITNSELDAFLLENNLIKKYKPKYNIDLRDSKRYAYIERTDEKFPRFIIARTNKTKGKAFGPFVSSKERDYILNTINRTFKFRTCKILPKRECLRYNIGICSGPCINKITEEEYMNNVKIAESVLLGNVENIIKDTQVKMKKLSKGKEYEKAIEYREIIHSLNSLKQRQEVERQKKYNEDIINYQIKGNTVYLLLFNIYKGMLNDKQEFVFDYKKDFIEEFLSRYYSENDVPKKIVLPVKISESLEYYINKKAKHKVVIVVPQRGELKSLLELVKKNVEVSFFSNFKKLEILSKELNLNTIPYIIECFDVSHLYGTLIVASMVQFKNGNPEKSNYRKYKIKTIDYNNDFASIKEVIYRRYYKLQKEMLPMPDLIVVDGGLGQLNSALDSLNKLSLKIPIISLAKQLEEIYIPGKKETIKLDNKNQGRLLLQAIRDEAHRFAINYNRSLRKI